MAVIVNSHNPIYKETNNDRYPRPIFASPGTAHPNPRSYCTRQRHPSSRGRPPLSPLLLPLASSPLSRHPNRNRISYRPIWTPSSRCYDVNDASARGRMKQCTSPPTRRDGRGRFFLSRASEQPCREVAHRSSPPLRIFLHSSVSVPFALSKQTLGRGGGALLPPLLC